MPANLVVYLETLENNPNKDEFCMRLTIGDPDHEDSDDTHTYCYDRLILWPSSKVIKFSDCRGATVENKALIKLKEKYVP